MATVKGHGGFSLLEVLIALTVFSTAALAMLTFSSRVVQQHSQLEDTTIALWVAENTLENIRMNYTWVPVGSRVDWIENGNRRWSVTATVENTSSDRLRRIVVEVSRESEPTPLVTLTGYRGQH